MEGLRRNVSYAVRSLGKRPIFTVAAGITLALGIGINTTLIGTIDFLFFRPPAHVKNYSELLEISIAGGFSYPAYKNLLTLREGLNHLTAYRIDTLSVNEGTAARKLVVAMVTSGYFQLLGITPHAGRYFTEEGSTHSVAVISYDFWRSRFNGEPAALGKEILITGKRYTIIGVAPEGFRGVTPGPIHAWVSVTDAPGRYKNPEYLTSRETGWLYLLTRLKARVPLKEVQRQIAETYVSQGGSPARKIRVYPLSELRTTNVRRARLFFLLAVTGGLVLLVCCMNVAGLLLLQFEERSRDACIRVAMGASRFHLVMQFLTEGMILALLGGATGVFLSLGMVSVFRGAYLPSDFSSWELLDFRAGGLTFVPIILTGLLIGLLPAIRASKPNLLTLINSGGYSATKRKSRAQQILVTGQIAITFAVLMEASLLVRSLDNWSAVDLGFDYENTMIAHVDLKNAGYSLTDIALLRERITGKLYALPGVRHVGAAYINPFEAVFYVKVILPDGRIPESSKPPV